MGDNIDFQEDVGLQTLIVRTDGGGCCDWCASVCGEFHSRAELPEDFWRIHRNCSCVIDYRVGKTNQKIKYKTNKDGSLDKIVEDNGKSDNIFGKARFKTQEMSTDEYARAVDAWNRVTELDIPQSEKEWVYEQFDNNLSYEEKMSHLVNDEIGNFRYFAVNKGHNQYKIYKKEPLREIYDWMDEIMYEVIGPDWKKYEI